MLQARFVALDAVGSDDDDRVSLGNVGVDLPALTLVTTGGVNEVKTVPTLDWLVHHADAVHQYRPDHDEPHALLVGGPGQGKTTLTALLAQIYRVALLSGSAALSPEAARLHAELSEQFQAAGLPTPRNRRWPIRVDLAAFAEFITSTGHASLLRYLAQRITVESPYEIESQQLNRWLGRYPWLLVLDGLDEVASPTLRTQVLSAISGFLVDASGAGGAADVVVVATTRPQGYADELDARDFAPVTLEHLPTDQALAYAGRLSKFRHPDNPDLRAHVHDRLVEAAGISMTARMMRTPLQVTIMCRLLERRQRVPQERYALFDAYFEAIYNREINKKGHIATLLEDRRRDVEWVHERVALTCQVDAETADGVSAAIPRSRLRELARGRLLGEGLPEDDADTIAGRIADAALHRLVLLVPHGAGDSVGFEIRSLQEFLAARALTGAADAEVVDRLQPLAPSAHWRNTWLFAAGQLFRTREWLRDSVLALLREVDLSDDLMQFAAAGAELAADLVQDGLASRSPDKNRALALHALEDLQRTPGLGWPVLAETLLLASDDEFTRNAVVRATSAAVAQGGGPRAAALLLCDWWRRRTGPLPAAARQLWLKQDSRIVAGPGFFRLAAERLDYSTRETFDRSRSVRDYLTDLLTEETEPARAFLELLGGRIVAAEPLDPAHNDPTVDPLSVPHAWVVHRGPRPEVQAIDDALTTEVARHALRRLLDAVPPADWHIVSTVRADIQHWLSRRPVGPDLPRSVYA
ncbi:NACHT domain-containing protein [Geodermatophilus sp. URMC 62]|uniref:NACHT domain-containing protein n=1 Tax=Geodermatophilus sp. URMC 62 TaxID=3423414 RepID=UPI00406C7A9D